MIPKDDFEAAYWGDCTNTYDEESKQYVYATFMRIPRVGFSFDGRGASVLDIGGGPVSMLLKTTGAGVRMVADPGASYWPTWVMHRYGCAGIEVNPVRGEDLAIPSGFYGEAWIYNVLQHTDDPERVIANARKVAPVLRIFEWVGVPAHEGHPHELHEEELLKWLGPGHGSTGYVNEGGAVGTFYAGVFRA